MSTQAPSRRAQWLRVLARAPADELARHATPVLTDYSFESLRSSEVGLMMVRARIGNTGDRFNLGEATVSRCTVRHAGPGGQMLIGIGHVLGRDPPRAEQVAQLDALLQRADLHELLWRDLVAPLAARRASLDRDERARTEASRVRFFTLSPEAT